jgi:hypothetical protein
MSNPKSHTPPEIMFIVIKDIIRPSHHVTFIPPPPLSTLPFPSLPSPLLVHYLLSYVDIRVRKAKSFCLPVLDIVRMRTRTVLAFPFKPSSLHTTQSWRVSEVAEVSEVGTMESPFTLERTSEPCLGAKGLSHDP